MQTIPFWLFCWQWIAAVLTLGASAASAMPVIIALTLAAGRRGNAGLSALGARTLARCAAALALLGPLLATGGVLALWHACAARNTCSTAFRRGCPPCCPTQRL